MAPILLALATLAVAPTVTFSNDSVYTDTNVISYEVRENYETILDSEGNAHEMLTSKDLVISERVLLGYAIYDVPETEYIDGLKVDDQWVYNWEVKDFDDTIAHTILVKTVYTDDIAGMLASAKDGDWSRIIANPLVVLQTIYFAVAGVATVTGGIGLFKSRKLKVKSSDSIAAAVSEKAAVATGDLKNVAINLVNSIVEPTMTKLYNQNQSIISALILQQSGDKDSKLALINLLKDTMTNGETDKLSTEVIGLIEKACDTKTEAKKEVERLLDEVIEDPAPKEVPEDPTKGLI